MEADENFYPSLFKYDFDIHVRHFERYFQAIKLLDRVGVGETWLDIACGSGYGTRLLSDFCDEAVGGDIDKNAVLYARKRYGSVNCIFTDDLKTLKKNQFNVIFSIETIEHMPPEEGDELLKNVRYWLVESGYLVITTPIVQKSNPNPKNPFHKYEYAENEFVSLLKNNGFTVIRKTLEIVKFTDGDTKEQGCFVCC